MTGTLEFKLDLTKVDQRVFDIYRELQSNTMEEFLNALSLKAVTLPESMEKLVMGKGL